MQVMDHGRGRVLSSGNWSSLTWFNSWVCTSRWNMTFTFLGDWSSPFSGGATTSTLIRSGNLRRSNLKFGDIYMFVSYACFSILKTFSRLRHSLSSASTFLPRLSTAPSIIHHMSKVSDFLPVLAYSHYNWCLPSCRLSKCCPHKSNHVLIFSSFAQNCFLSQNHCSSLFARTVLRGMINSVTNALEKTAICYSQVVNNN